MADRPSLVGFVPARGGSKRVPDKNIKRLNGHPLLGYAIASALESGIFDRVICSTDSEQYAAIARHYGAEVPFMRPAEYATDTSPDFEWIDYTVTRLKDEGHPYECFAILRPTSPFRTADTIRRAWDVFCAEDGVDSLRAVEKCGQHPGKMWIHRNNRLLPILPYTHDELGQPWHNCQYAALPEIYVQNASLEIAWTRILKESGTISGRTVMPFFTSAIEGHDINIPFDLAYAEHLLNEGEAILPIPAATPWSA